MTDRSEIRGSVLVELCLIVDILVVLQCLALPFVRESVESVAWVRPGESSALDWFLLYAWVAVGCVPPLMVLRGDNKAAYPWLVVAYAAFWAFAIAVNVYADPVEEELNLGVALLFGLILWRQSTLGARRASLAIR